MQNTYKDTHRGDYTANTATDTPLTQKIHNQFISYIYSFEHFLCARHCSLRSAHNTFYSSVQPSEAGTCIAPIAQTRKLRRGAAQPPCPKAHSQDVAESPWNSVRGGHTQHRQGRTHHVPGRRRLGATPRPTAPRAADTPRARTPRCADVPVVGGHQCSVPPARRRASQTQPTAPRGATQTAAPQRGPRPPRSGLGRAAQPFHALRTGSSQTPQCAARLLGDPRGGAGAAGVSLDKLRQVQCSKGDAGEGREGEGTDHNARREKGIRGLG